MQINSEQMARKKIIIEEKFSIGDLELIPVAELITSYYAGKNGIYFSVVKRPVAMIIITKEEVNAFSIYGDRLSLKQLLREIPELNRCLCLG